jgi:hypothetical protein
MAVGVLVFLALVAVALWMRRLDAEEFAQGAGSMTEDERRAMQVGIGLRAGNNSGGF